jgi:CheY-like chemotaxis protein
VSAVSALVVEEDPDVRALVGLVLEEMLGISVYYAENGGQATRLAQRWRPHLILLDSLLPDGSGAEVARRLKADPATREIPLIALTTRPRSEVLRAGLYDDYIAKPFDLHHFESAVRRHLPGVGDRQQRVRAA